MKIIKKSLVLIALLFPSFFTLASWVKLTDKELVEEMNVAVVGEFIGKTTMSTYESNGELVVGIIKIDSVLAGSFSDDFLLLVIQKAGTPIISSMVNFKKGQQGLWLLKQHSSVTPFLFSASHPQQFISSSDINRLKTVRSIILNSPH